MKVNLLVAFLAVAGLGFTLFKANLPAKTGINISEQTDPNLFDALGESDKLKAKNKFQHLIKGPEETQNDSKSKRIQNISVAITNIESDLKNGKAIQRLNADNVEPDERVKLGGQLQNLANLRAQALEQQLKDIENSVAELSASHPSRLQVFGMTP